MRICAEWGAKHDESAEATPIVRLVRAGRGRGVVCVDPAHAVWAMSVDGRARAAGQRVGGVGAVRALHQGARRAPGQRQGRVRAVRQGGQAAACQRRGVWQDGFLQLGPVQQEAPR